MPNEPHDPASPQRPHSRARRRATLVLGLTYLALGIAGFAAYGWSPAGPDGSRTIWVLGVSAVLNIVHLVVGLLALVASRKNSTTLAYLWFAFYGFAGLGAYSVLASALGEPGNLLDTTPANAWLYGATSLVSVTLAVLPDKRGARSTGGARRWFKGRSPRPGRGT